MLGADKDEWSQTRQQIGAHIDICMGGRVAEELVFGADQAREPHPLQSRSQLHSLCVLLRTAVAEGWHEGEPVGQHCTVRKQRQSMARKRPPLDPKNP